MEGHKLNPIKSATGNQKTPSQCPEWEETLTHWSHMFLSFNIIV